MLDFRELWEISGNRDFTIFHARMEGLLIDKSWEAFKKPSKIVNFFFKPEEIEQFLSILFNQSSLLRFVIFGVVNIFFVYFFDDVNIIANHESNGK